MIFRPAGTKAFNWSFGAASDDLEVRPEDFHAALYKVPPKKEFPIFVPPVRRRKLARVATLVSARVYEGFSWHNACYAIGRDNWRIILEDCQPDYFLVESCLRDSANAWPYSILDKNNYADLLTVLAGAATRANVPAIYWHTLGHEYLDNIPYKALSKFDIVACADERSLEVMRKCGLEPKFLPWGFSPEQFNPLTYPGIEYSRNSLIFEGIARMMRFPAIAATLEKFAEADLEIFDSGLLTPPYNLERFSNRMLAEKVIGNLPKQVLPIIYKDAGAYLLLGNEDGLSSSLRCSALEAAGTRAPVLYMGKSEECPDFATSFPSPEYALEYWHELHKNRLMRERDAHLAWRKAHKNHAFANRMQTIHEWLGLDGEGFRKQKASIIVPSMRPQNFKRVLDFFDSQTWPNKELIFVHNGPREQTPDAGPRKDVLVLHIPPEQATGLAMNAGLCNATGEICFKCDDDDLYGPDYVADRMLQFREFAIDSLSTARPWWTFGDSGVAVESKKKYGGGENTVFAMGEARYDFGLYPGSSFAMRREYGLKVGFTGPAHAYADVSFINRAILFSPASIHLQTDNLNMAIRRDAPEKHTWSASEPEIRSWLGDRTAPLKDIFV